MEDNPPPALFATEGTEVLPDHPALLGGRCTSCGYTFFPMQTYGCEQCGSIALEEVALTGRGRLVSSAEVHISMNKSREAPYVVGSIILDDEAVVRSILDVAPGTRLAAGTPLVTTLVPETRADRGDHDLRFKPVVQEAE